MLRCLRCCDDGRLGVRDGQAWTIYTYVRIPYKLAYCTKMKPSVHRQSLRHPKTYVGQPEDFLKF